MDKILIMKAGYVGDGDDAPMDVEPLMPLGWQKEESKMRNNRENANEILPLLPNGVEFNK